MAKLTLTDITSGYQSTTVYNANNTLIEAALENTLSRDGTTPNTMSANFDMNSNKIVNVTDGTNNQDAVTLAQLNAASVVASTAAASAVTLADAGGFYAATTVEAAFAELASTSANEGASIIGVEDSAANYTATDVEGVLAEIAGAYYSSGDTPSFANLTLDGTAPNISWDETDATTNERYWDLSITAGLMNFKITNDAQDSVTSLFTIDRTAHTAATMQLQGAFTLDCNERPVQNAVITNYSLPVETGAISSGVCTIDLDDGNAVEVSLTENITSWTVNNQPSSGYYEILIKFIQDATGSRTVAWAGEFSSVDWPGGTAPTITTTATTGTDIISLKTWDAGTTWYGDFSQDYS